MARSRNITWDYTGEGFIKELDFGRVWLRLNEAEEGTKDDIVAEWKEDAKKFLQEAMVRQPQFMLHVVPTHSAGPHSQANLVRSRWEDNRNYSVRGSLHPCSPQARTKGEHQQ